MVIYVVLIGTATEMQRQNLLEGVGKLEQAHRVEAQLHGNQYFDGANAARRQSHILGRRSGRRRRSAR